MLLDFDQQQQESLQAHLEAYFVAYLGVYESVLGLVEGLSLVQSAAELHQASRHQHQEREQMEALPSLQKPLPLLRLFFPPQQLISSPALCVRAFPFFLLLFPAEGSDPVHPSRHQSRCRSMYLEPCSI